MSAAATLVREDLNWPGLLVLVALAVVIFGYGCRRGDRTVTSMIAEAFEPGVIDHADCAADDCDQVICHCNYSRAQAHECAGTTTLGCDHGEGLCWDCRGKCSECLAETRAESTLVWLREIGGAR